MIFSENMQYNRLYFWYFTCTCIDIWRQTLSSSVKMQGSLPPAHSLHGALLKLINDIDVLTEKYFHSGYRTLTCLYFILTRSGLKSRRRRGRGEAFHREQRHSRVVRISEGTRRQKGSLFCGVLFATRLSNFESVLTVVIWLLLGLVYNDVFVVL